MQDLETRLSLGPLFVTRKGSNIVLYHGGFQRWKSAKIAAVEVRWKSNWQVSYRGQALGEDFVGSLASEKTTCLPFRGVIGHMTIGDTGNATVQMSREKHASYAVHIADTESAWEVVLAGRRTRDHDVTVEVSCNGKKVVAAPSSHETWTEGVCSVGGFVRHKWGDWLLENDNALPLPAAVACLCCVGFHNSVLGDLLVSDTPIG